MRFIFLIKTGENRIFMHFFKKILILISCSISIGFLGSLKSHQNPLNPFLSRAWTTWTSDPSSTMTIVWASRQHLDRVNGNISYAIENEQTNWIKAFSKQIPIDQTDVILHNLTLRNLKENQIYVFKIEGDTEIYRFRTMPSSPKGGVRFVVGGDLYRKDDTEAFQTMNQLLSQQELDFIVLGGDLAYTHSWKYFFKSRQWEIDRWLKFMQELTSIRGGQNRLVPLLMAVGNHDIQRSGESSISEEILYHLFGIADSRVSYRCLDFGSYLSLLLLDTGHSCPISGKQTLWLQQTLQAKSSSLFKMAVYHEAAYPSYYLYNGWVPKQIRKYWVPLFEQYGLHMGFEHHNHCYKRTYPIKNGRVDHQGVTYLGDGCWGVRPRQPYNFQKAWFLAKTEALQSCYIVNLNQDRCEIQACTPQGIIIDKIVIPSGQMMIPKTP